MDWRLRTFCTILWKSLMLAQSSINHQSISHVNTVSSHHKPRWSMESNDYQQIGQSTNDVCIEMDLLQVGSEPVGMRCPFCQEDVMTKALYRNSSITHLVGIILGVLFWWLCCCFVPYLTTRWKNVEHYCPNCRKFLGVYSRTRIF